MHTKKQKTACGPLANKKLPSIMLGNFYMRNCEAVMPLASQP